MELSWNDRRTRQFLTNVGLITTDGPHGPNVMAAEWTHHVSYSPSLIPINVCGNDATAENINQSKEFGVNLELKTKTYYPVSEEDIQEKNLIRYLFLR